jgi:hypothetical protein
LGLPVSGLSGAVLAGPPAPPTPPTAPYAGAYAEAENPHAAAPALLSGPPHQAGGAHAMPRLGHRASSGKPGAPPAKVATVTVGTAAPAAATPKAVLPPPTTTPAFGTTNSITSTNNAIGFAPPDTQIATGTTANVELVNDVGSITYRNQSPTQAFFDLNRFFGVPAGFLFSDPKIVYDPSVSRFYISGLSFDSSSDGYVYLAVSQTNDPGALWWIYTILDQSTTKAVCDQPHLGFSSNNIVVACDDFTSSTVVPNSGYMMIDKGNALSGTAYEYIRFFGANDGGRHFSMQPVYETNPTGTEYLVYNDGSGVGVLGVWGSVPAGSVGYGDAGSPLIAGMSAPPAAVQKGSTTLLDTGDIRILSAVMQGNVIWTTAGDSCTPTGDTAQHACMRLDRVDVSKFPQVALNFDYDVGSVGTDLFYPAVTMDASGTAYLAFSASSANIYPEFDIAVITPATPDAIDQAFQIVAGFGSYSGPSSTTGGPARWGDYSGAEPDPNDAHGVILAGEFSGPTGNTAPNWMTQGGTFRVPACNSVNLTYGSGNPAYPGQIVNFNASSNGCWGTPQYRFWEQAPGTGWKIVQDYGTSSSYAWDTSKESTLGTYKFEVDVRSHGFVSSYDQVSVASLTLAATPPCPITVTTNPASPAATGSSVQITATPGTCQDQVYRFWIRPPGGPWTVVQDYGKANTYTWTSTGLAGTYGVEIDVNGRLNPASAYTANNLTYTLNPCSGAGLTASPASPSQPGTAITLTATATCPGTPSYRFWLRPPGGAWSVAQDWSATATYSWQTTGIAQGTYGLDVDVRDQGSTAGYESVATQTYLVTNTLCAPGLTAAPPSPGATGAAVTFTATAPRCPNPRFRFWLQPPGGSWSIAQDYSNGSGTFAWAGAGVPGTYNVEVDARDASETVAYDAVANLSYQVKGCSAAGLAASPASPQAPGGTVTFTASSTCPGTAVYRFWLRPPGGAWRVTQDYSTTATYAWPTAGLALGSYGLEVDVRDQGATGAYEATTNTSYVVGQPCAQPTLSANIPSPSASGTPFTLTATTSGCPNPQYRFWTKPPGGTWSTSGYNTVSTYSGSGITGGNTSFEVDVRDSSESVSYDAVATITIDFVACSNANLVGTPMNAPQGPVINFVGSASCPYGGNPEYRFWEKTPGGTWQIVEDYPIGVNNYMWSYPGLPHGTYYFEVDVRNKYTGVSYETVAVTSYTI